ncbi:chitinase-3-like protein 1 [Ischnura elegans]|uniref:chitinase-3-like protein 1 n=1 Tax=Ischnura elegans TaxID=197161 RepID=UPI001ED8A409|nr:chitinase-3-like protein 1 [Ischnura elegans]
MEVKSTALVLALLSAVVELAHTQKVVCYLGSWATYRPGDGRFEVEYIDPSLCTHVIYSFVGIGEDAAVNILDTWNDLSINGGKGAIQRFNALKSRNPSLKTIMAIGGWNQGSATFSRVVNNAALRRKFVDNIVAFVKQYGFDGFDLDWEYPVQRGGSPNDKTAFSDLIKELRAEFDKYGFSLSAAVPASKTSVETSYDVVALGRYLDFINIMTYDLHGSWDPVTGHNAPLYARSNEIGFATHLNDHASIQHWIEKGVPRQKLILGVPSYGRTWTLRSTSNTGIGAPASGPGNPGRFTSEAGMIGYNELCVAIKNEGWEVHWDEEQKVPYAVKGNQWASYDNLESIKIKAEYALKEQLGGVMLWSLETDDFHGYCDGIKFPILNTIKNVFQSSIHQPTTEKNYGDHGDEKVEINRPEATAGPCITTGYMRDHNDCSKFYYCVEVSGKMVPYPLKCPEGLVFDKNYSNCNYKESVQC